MVQHKHCLQKHQLLLAWFGSNLKCRVNKALSVTRRNVVTIDGFEDVPENDEAALQKAVAKQPVSVAICASSGLQFYSSGVVEKGCCTELDHGVLAVGYDVVSMLLYQVTKIVAVAPAARGVIHVPERTFALLC